MVSIFISILILSIIQIPTSSFSPRVQYFLNCGSSVTATLQDDSPPRFFTTDYEFLTSHSTSEPISSTLSSTTSLYSTARIFNSSTSYKFDTKAQGTYIIRLHFSPITSGSYNLSNAVISVTALNNFMLLTDFSTNKIIIKEYFLWIDVDELVITFATDSFAFVSAIEVFIAPTTLIDDVNATHVPPNGNSGLIGQLPNKGVETVYRINVGGDKVTPANDTVWRTWLPDDPYMYQSSLSSKNSTDSSRISYGTGDPRRTREVAPQSVYDTARTMAISQSALDSIPNFDLNLSWTFKVPPNNTYLIRMHFCNFLFPEFQPIFNVYISNLAAYPNLSPTDFMDGESAVPFYMDFAAEPDLNGNMNISVGRSPLSTRDTANAILNGLEVMKIGLDSVDDKSNSGNSKKILIFSVACGLFFVLALGIVLFFLCRKRSKGTSQQKRSLSSWHTFRHDEGTSSLSATTRSSVGTNASLKALQIPYDEIAFATDNFSDRLQIGSGGFGKVYKGVFRDGMKVAVKKGTAESKQGYPEFLNEIKFLSQIRHKHLVSLIGYCEDQSEMILVYEYMEKGPLKDSLYGSNMPFLTWKQRLEICVGAARGLYYLHTGYSQSVIHRDIKSTNILLDEHNLAKVADFGLSREGPTLGETHVSTCVKGTFGYLDPEYFKVQKLTAKSDVYSFGVMLFEVLCARPVIDPKLSRDEINLAEWALRWQRRGKLEKVIDRRLAGEINANSLKKFGETAEKCLAEYGVDRPTMGDVLWNLEYALKLQETEVRREAYEDSGKVESQAAIQMMRKLPSNVGLDEDNANKYKEEAPTSTEDGRSGMAASAVFSQLMSDDGR